MENMRTPIEEHMPALVTAATWMLLCVPDTGGLEVRSHGDWQASALHLFPSDNSRNNWNSHGCATYIWICGSRQNNRDLSREMRTWGIDFLGFGHSFTTYIWRVSSSRRMVCFQRSSSKCHYMTLMKNTELYEHCV